MALQWTECGGKVRRVIIFQTGKVCLKGQDSSCLKPSLIPFSSRRDKDLLEEMVEEAVREVIFKNEINIRMRDLSKPGFRNTQDQRTRRKPKKNGFLENMPFRMRPHRKKKQKITKICC